MTRILVLLKNFRTAWQTRWMAKTGKSRAMLRHQRCLVGFKEMRVLDYIDLVASRMVKVKRNGKPVDHRTMLREIYYKYDLQGLNYYINRMVKRNRREVNYLKRKIKISK